MCHKVVVLFTVVTSVVLLAGHAAAQTRDWHTTPDKWKEPRVFHRPFDPLDTAITKFEVQRDSTQISTSDTVWSANRAYYFSSSHPHAVEWHSPCTRVLVYNERPYIIHMSFVDDPRYDPDVRWINEKLLYIEVWWGRVLGSAFIYDVEKEQIIYQEMVVDGLGAFQQWHEVRGIRKK